MGGKKKGVKVDQTVVVMLSKADFEKFKEGLANSTCRGMSEYGRKLLTGRPVTMFYRDKAFDAFVQEAIALRNYLQLLGPASAHFLPLLEQIKTCINKIYDHVRQNKSQHPYKGHA